MAAAIGTVRRAVVDASPLLSALVLNFSISAPAGRQQGILDRSRVADYLRNEPRRRQAFIELFRSIREINTTSHVIGELQGLQKLRDVEQKGFWLSSMNWLAEKKLDEKLVRLLDLRGNPLEESLYRIGPCDTGLVELARREGATLLTDDRRTLAPFALNLGVDCRVVEDMLPRP
jgi:hypothetical protein